MKFLNLFLSLILIVTPILIIDCLKTKTTSKLLSGLKSSEKTKYSKEALINNVNFSAFFWKQIFDASKDPIYYMKNTQRFNYWQYLILSDEAISFTESARDLDHIQSN